MTFKLPTHIETNIDGYEILAGMYDKLSGKETEVFIDFSTCEVFDGNLVAALGAVFDKLLSEGYQVMLIKPKAGKVRRTLGRNGFLKAWQIMTDVQEKEYFVEYRSFTTNKSDEFKSYIDSQLIHKQKFPQHTELVGKYILENIYEIYANATMHGFSRSVNCCGEYSEDEKVLHMTIVDCGTTIAENVNSYMKERGKQNMTDEEAIEWAFIEGNTTKKNTGGLGLALLKEFIRQNQGSLDIVSGSGMLSIKEGQTNSCLLKHSFPGTIVNVNFNFNDEKNYYIEGEDSIDINDLL